MRGSGPARLAPERQADPSADGDVAREAAAFERVGKEAFQPGGLASQGHARTNAAAQRELGPAAGPVVEQGQRDAAREIRRAEEVARPGAALELVQHVEARNEKVRRRPDGVEGEADP